MHSIRFISPVTICVAYLLLCICFVPSALAGTVSVDLNSVALPSGGSTPAGALLALYGITISNVTAGSSVVVENDPCCSPRNVIEETNPSLGVVSYTMNFSPPLSELKFSRAAITLGTPVHPSWSVSVYAGSAPVTTVGEGFTYLPAPSPSHDFDISAPGITSMVVTSDNGHFAAFTSALLDNFVITQASQITLVDPVPSLVGALAGQDLNALATGGRVVLGVAADGVSQLLLRVPTTSIGSFNLTVLNDQNSTSNNVADDGGLAAPGPTPTFLSTITVTSRTDNSTSGSPIAFAVYQAPTDFVRSNSSTDPYATQRTVSISLQSQGSSIATQPVVILRPPVVLVHGLWGDRSDWDCFSPLVDPTASKLCNGAVSDPRFFVRAADYSREYLVDSNYIFPSYPWNFNVVSGSSLGFYFNASKVASQIQAFVSEFKNQSNPAGLPLAAVQADIVAHSMGGLVTRTMPLLPSFYSQDTFSKGIVHKLITIGTPHQGTPLATQLSNNSNTCVRNLLALNGKASIDWVAYSLGPAIVKGGVFDLHGDLGGTGLSQALMDIKTPVAGAPTIPTTMIGGVADSSQIDNLSCLSRSCALGRIIHSICGGIFNDPLGLSLTKDNWQTVVSSQSDAIVPFASQVNGSTTDGFLQVDGVVHSHGAETLGFMGPSELDPNGVIPGPALTIPGQVTVFLNTNVGTPGVFIPLP